MTDPGMSEPRMWAVERAERLYLDPMDDGPRSGRSRSAPSGSSTAQVHMPFTDDGVTYCGWDLHEGCGEVWPCATVRERRKREQWARLAETSAININLAAFVKVEAERNEALATIARVRALHVCSLFLCRGCKAAWPCPTIRALGSVTP